jgi:hypothetical protein
MVVAAAASGAVLHEFLEKPSGKLSEGVPAGAKAPAVTGPLSEVRALTVMSGHVWVGEQVAGAGGETRVDEFDASTGEFEEQLPQEPALGGLDRGVAVGAGTGEREVYVGSTEGDVGVFGPSGVLQASWTGAGTPEKSFTESSGGRVASVNGVAVDHSTDKFKDWAAGDVYVATGEVGAPAGFDVVDVFSPVAGGGEPGKVVAQLKGTCPVAGSCAASEVIPFSDPRAVAVSASNGDVLVVDGLGTVDVFEPTVGEYAFVRQLTGTPSGPLANISSVAADDSGGNIYVANNIAEPVVDEFSAKGEYLGRLTGTPAGSYAEEGVAAVAVDPETRHVFVGNSDFATNEGFVDVYGPDVVIPDVSTAVPVEVLPTEAVLAGTVDPLGEGEASCQFVWGASKSFGQVGVCPVVLEGVVAVGREVRLEGLTPDAEYCYRLQAANKNGLNPGEAWQDECFVTPGPGLRNASVSDVSSSAVTFEGMVDPHGHATHAYFQYGRSTSYEGGVAPAAPGVDLGDGEGTVPVPSQHVQGLTANVTYHYRLVVSNELTAGQVSVFVGPDQTFQTQAVGGSSSPPDAPQNELVSPPDKHGAVISGISEAGVIQAAKSGTGITYFASAPTEAGASVGGYLEAVQLLSTRGSSSWTSEDMALAHSSAAGSVPGNGHDFRFFTDELNSALVEPVGEFTSLAPEVFPADTERTPYLRHNSTCAATATRHTCYEPLVTGAPGFTDVPAGTAFGGEPGVNAIGGVHFLGATEDLSHVVMSSEAPLTSAPAAVEALYEWSSGAALAEELRPVSVLAASEGGATVSAVLGENNESEHGPNARHAISGDGSRVFWSEEGSDGGHLFLRDLAKGETVRLDKVQGGTGTGNPDPKFQLGDSAGSVVLFSDEQQLTAGSGAENGHADLYQCVIVQHAGEDECALSDLTPPVGGQRAAVQGVIAGTSSDSSYLYFVGTGVLSGTPNGHGESAAAGNSNLYVLHRGGAGAWEAPVFVAGLSGEDKTDWGRTEGLLPQETAETSGDGRWFVFMSDRSLTGYDNRDVVSERPDEEVFLYDATAGRLVCASCNPSGGRPAGVEYAKLNGGLVGGFEVWESTVWLAANVPAWTSFHKGKARYQSRYLSGDGRVFFNSSDALVPRDVNGNEDVYEFDPLGVNGCSEGSGSFSGRSGGCVSLVSSGVADGESAFLDASESGGDVFFLTGETLVHADKDTALDVYDAHVCNLGAQCFVEAAEPPVCASADACRAAPSVQPPIFGSPATGTFSGAGNPPLTVTPAATVVKKPLTRAQKLAGALKVCHRDKRKSKRAACERSARKRFGAKAAAKTPGKPGAGKRGGRS